MKQVTLPDFLTDAEISAAHKLFRENRTSPNKALTAFLSERMPEINKKLGQENDARYLAYAIEHIFTQAEKLQ